MSGKHTPGPWEALPICEVSGWVDIVTREKGGFPSLPFASCKHLNQEANARLIATAPEMLAALVMIRDADEDCRLDGLPMMPDGARAEVDAAIAKATGEPTKEQA